MDIHSGWRLVKAETLSMTMLLTQNKVKLKSEAHMASQIRTRRKYAEAAHRKLRQFDSIYMTVGDCARLLSKRRSVEGGGRHPRSEIMVRLPASTVELGSGLESHDDVIDILVAFLPAAYHDPLCRP